MQKSQNKSPKNKQKPTDINQLEARISRIEEFLKLEPMDQSGLPEAKQLFPKNISKAADNLEFRIGQFWFAKTGIVVLAIGIVFLLTLPYENWPSALPSSIGYIIVGLIFSLSYLWKMSYEFLSRYLLGGGLLLLFFTTMRLHFFSINPVIQNRMILVLLLTICVAISIIISIRRKSVYLASLALTLGHITAIIAESAIPLFLLLVLLAFASTFFKLKYRWDGLYIYGIILTYFVHFVWFINNPFLGKAIQFVGSPKINVLFILLYFVAFSLGNFFRNKDIPENNMVASSTFLNCVSGYGLFLLVTTTKIAEHLFIAHFLASLLFLTLSTMFWIKEKSKLCTFYYSILGYTALSVAIVAQFKIPDSLIFLCWQSLLVISTALWYRSRFIIVANFIIFIIIFLSYLSTVPDAGPISISFGIVALLSARITNWQKHRLELQTEFMRNAYLTMVFISIPYALYHSVPTAYVSLAWIGAAIFYYILSIILKNKKYRWLALLTLLLTVLYILIIGIIQLTPTFRIISFMVLGLVLLIISLQYSRMKLKKTKIKQ